MNVAGKVLQIGAGLIQDAAAQEEAAKRQAQIMDALKNVENAIQSLQVEQGDLADIIVIEPSITEIQTWQEGYPEALQSGDKAKIQGFLQTFYKEDTGGARDIIQNIFNVLTGPGLGPSSGTPPLLQSWHLQSYKKMYTASDGQYSFTLRNYLDDYNKRIAWAIGMMGYAMVCQIVAVQALANPATAAQGETKDILKQFADKKDTIFSVAYDQFPSFVKKFKPNYTDEGTNLSQWFRMWRPGCHIKNYVGWEGDTAPDQPDGEYYIIQGLDCDDDEGIYPELEFRFDETNHPLHGLATLMSRVDGATVNIYNRTFSGLTTTTDASYWYDGVSFTPATFNVLPVSADDMGGNTAPGFVALVANAKAGEELIWSPGSVSPSLVYWILRDDGLVQSSWIRTKDSDSTVPGEPSRAPGPNPE